MVCNTFQMSMLSEFHLSCALLSIIPITITWGLSTLYYSTLSYFWVYLVSTFLLTLVS